MRFVDDELVGRSPELAQIDALFNRVSVGEGSVVVVSGEAGVGKTALLEELARRADGRGFAVAVGRCATSESLPHWPWQRVLRMLGGSDDEFAAATIGGRAALFAAAADRLERATAERPVFVIIDDLQWADESAVALASFLVAATAGLRIGLAFGVRDEPAEMTAQLKDALAALPADVARLALGGLDIAATAELLSRILDHQPSPAIVGELHARTGGNPLFVKECARLLLRGEANALVVPDRVRQVITRRVAQLPKAAYATLAAAAVADDLDLELLATLTDMTNAEVADGLNEAMETRLLTADEDGFRFAHALIRQTLVDTQPAARRTELHQRCATALEARLDNVSVAERTALAGQAAAHWARVPGEGRRRAARLALVAARGATDQLGYDHAVRLYQWALELGDDNLETLTELGEAQILSGQLAQGRATLAAAATRAAAEHRGEELTRAVLAAGSGVGGYEVDLRDELQVARLRDALPLLGEDDSRLRAAALARIALIDTSLAQDDRAALVQGAAAMAARVGDIAGEVAALAARCDILSGPDHVADRLLTTKRMVELAQRQRDPVILLVARRHQLLALLEHGEIARADEEIVAYARSSDHLRLPLYSWIVPVWRGMRALMDGDYQRAGDHHDAARALGLAAGSVNADVLTFSLRFEIARAKGSTVELDQEVERLLGEYSGYPPADGLHSVHLLLSDRADQAGRVLQRRMAVGLDSVTRDSEWLETMWNLGEVAVGVGATEAAEAVHAALVPYAELWAIDGVGAACYGVVAHQLGKLSIALGRSAEARGWLDQAEDVQESAGAGHLASRSKALRDSVAAPHTPSARPRAKTTALLGELSHDGGVWHVRWQGTTTIVRHSKGFADIARLLEHPGHEVHVLDLMNPTGAAPDSGGAGPMLDDTAKRAYKQRLDQLEADLDEANAMANDARAEQLDREREYLIAEITRAYGLGGRSRTTGDPAERARKAVSMRIATAIKAVAASDAELARHLERSIVTGRYCSYQPETETEWLIKT